MAKRSKKPADLNRLAAAIVGEATDDTPQEPESQQARAGRAGGRKGGKAKYELLIVHNGTAPFIPKQADLALLSKLA